MKVKYLVSYLKKNKFSSIKMIKNNQYFDMTNFFFYLSPNSFLNYLVLITFIFIDSIRNYLKEYKHALFLDVGAMIGNYNRDLHKVIKCFN